MALELAADQKKLVETLVSKPELKFGQFELRDYWKFWRTNNWLQWTAAFNQVYDYADNKWYFLKGDSSGFSYVKNIMLSRNSADLEIISDLVIDANATLILPSLDVAEYSGKTLLVSTSGNCTVYPQFSYDETNWYDWCDAAGVAISYAVNNVKKAIGINDFCHYLRFTVKNETAAAVTVSASVSVMV